MSMAGSISCDINFSQISAIGSALTGKFVHMRSVDPVFFSEASGGIWVATGHREVGEGFSGKKPLSAVRLPDMVVGAIRARERASKIPYILKNTPHWVINMDRPGQTRLRTFAMKAFGPGIAESLRPYIRRFIDEAFAAVAHVDHIEFVGSVARIVPARTILKLLGLPDSFQPKLHEWSIAMNEAFGGINQPETIILRGERALLEMRDHFLPEIEARSQSPTDDFISASVTARDEGSGRLSEEELLGMLYLVLVAGQDTTANTIALGTAALAKRPEARRQIRKDPQHLQGAVVEIMRYVAMSTMMPRVATEDFDWNGHQILRGQLIFLMIAGANHDPAAFPEPAKFDATRPQAGNMTFAPGLHF
jgi:cytochrome P450